MSRTREDQGQDIDVARRLKNGLLNKKTNKQKQTSANQKANQQEQKKHIGTESSLSLATTYVMSTCAGMYGLSSLEDHDVDGRSSCRRLNHVDRAGLKHIFTTDRYAGNRATNPPHVHEKW